MLATGFKQWFMSASIVTRYDVEGESFVEPGSRFGTITNLEKHLGSSHFSTTGVVRTKCSNTLHVAVENPDEALLKHRVCMRQVMTKGWLYTPITTKPAHKTKKPQIMRETERVLNIRV